MLRQINAAKFRMLVDKMRGKPTARLLPGARLYGSARIYNMGTRDDEITIGEGSIVRGELLRFAHGGQITIGRSCYIGHGTRIWSGTNVTIGDNVLIAHNVSIFDNLTHPLDWRERREHFKMIASSGHPAEIDLGDRPVTIGNDAWIGAQSIVLRGVTIGERAVVAAGAVVTQNVPADTIVGGNPAKVIRENETTSEFGAIA